MNGSSPQSSHNLPHQNTPTQQQTNQAYPFMNSPSVLSGYGATSNTNHGARPVSSGSDHRRGSINLPSPLSAAPVLAANNNSSYAGANLPVPVSPALNRSSSPHLPKSSPAQAPAVVTAAPSQQELDVPHASALPPAATGVSPTKHSPPRPTTSNGNLGLATPFVLPPVASLTPSPQHQNLTPPVKLSEPERTSPTGRAVAP